MITKQEYLDRVERNKQIYIDQVSTKSFDFTKYDGFDALASEVPVVKLLKKVHDIYTAVNLNMLPYLKETIGADAVRLNKDDSFVDIELKSCYVHVNPKTTFKTTRCTVYTTKDVSLWGDSVDKNKVALLTSSFKAQFDTRSAAMYTKNRDTYLLLIDGDTSDIIDCYMLSGEYIIDFLETSSDIKLGSFMKYGKSVKEELNNSLGWDIWLNKLLPTLQTKKVIYY